MASYAFSGDYQAIRAGVIQVRYVSFTVTAGGTVTIDVANTGTAGNGDDSQIKLFEAGSAGHIGRLVAEADGFPSDTMTVTLGPGTYILAISEAVLTVAEAGNGDNEDDDVPPFGYTVTITEGTATLTQPVEAQVGTDAAETFTGTDASDTIWAHGGADTINGGGGADLIFGDDGADRIDGGAGVDVMDGGFGNDVYTLDSQQDAVIEVPGAGTDEIRTALAAFTMAGGYANVEILTGISGAGQALTGNDEANTINGACGVDTLRGGGGDDTLAGNDGNDVLHGEIGNDTLRGGLGEDQLIGGEGNDTYVVDTSDTITELAGGGSDTVRADFSYTLGAELENLTLTGSGTVDGTGNAVANLILGNGAANRLDGGLGADTMQGGSGNDTYIYDNSGDRAYDSSAADGGVDLVLSSVTATLTTWVENLTLTGTGDTTGVGNALANTIIGNSGNNVLSGAAGADTMIGGSGNDTYHYDHLGDRAHDASGPSGGIDTVLSSVSATLTDFVENLTLTGTAATTGVGNALANTIAGNSGNNPLAGMAGADIMSGGGGNDSYVYFSTSDSTVAVRDRILGFDSGDLIDLSRIDANSNTAANDAFTFIGSAAFSGTAGELRAYQSVGDWFVEADVNGDGSADLMIAVSTDGGYSLAAADFVA